MKWCDNNNTLNRFTAKGHIRLIEIMICLRRTILFRRRKVKPRGLHGLNVFVRLA